MVLTRDVMRVERPSNLADFLPASVVRGLQDHLTEVFSGVEVGMGLHRPIAIQCKSPVHHRSEFAVDHTLENLTKRTSKYRLFRSQVKQVNAEYADVWFYERERVEAGCA